MHSAIAGIISTAWPGRSNRVPGSPHDTLVWAKLADDPAALVVSASIFTGPATRWTSGLAIADKF